MKGKNKSSMTSLPDILKYIANKMSGRERNSFERELQKDSFADEAAEGLSGISPEEVSGDMSRLNKRLGAKINRRKKIVFYRIAASVAVLMIISSLFYLVNRNKESNVSEEIAYNVTPLEIPESKAITIPEKARSEVTEEAKLSEPVKEKIPPAIHEAEGYEVRMDLVKDVFVKKAETLVVVESVADSVFAKEDQAKAAAPAAQPDTENKVSDEPSLVALHETVVVGYGVSKRAKAAVDEADNTETGYSVPEPVNGRKEFDKYIEENIKNPVSLSEGKREVVVVSFTVTRTGSIEKIRIIKTPGDEFSKEAERLVKYGPAWKPAVSNGGNIDAEVRVRIIFK